MKIREVILIGFMLLCVLSCTPVRESYTHPEGTRYMGQFAEETPEVDGQFKVVTYNIKLGKKLEQAIYELEQQEGLRDADVIFLQEMDANGVYEMAKRLQYDYFYYPAALHSTHDKGFGNAILSKWPIKEHQKIVLPHEHPIRKMYRIAVFALLAVKKEGEAQGKWNPFLDCISGIIHVRMGESDKARQIFDNLLERSNDVNISPYYIAALSVTLGEMDKGFDFLDKAYREKDFWIRELMVDSLFEDVRSDPRYDTMLRKLRLK
jgi:hypothetical protein